MKGNNLRKVLSIETINSIIDEQVTLVHNQLDDLLQQAIKRDDVDDVIYRASVERSCYTKIKNTI